MKNARSHPYLCRLSPPCIPAVCFYTDDRREVELLPLISFSRPPIFLCGHWGAANQFSDAEEDWPVDPREGKKIHNLLKLDFFQVQDGGHSNNRNVAYKN